MAWSTPLTAVSGSVLTAAQWNTSVRDNLNETAPAKATAAGQIFVSTAANAIAARTIAADYLVTSESTASTTFTDLATSGPAVTATTAASCIVAIYSHIFSSVAADGGSMSYDISGATTDPSNDNRAIQQVGTSGQRVGATFFHSAILTPGTNTFTAKYKAVTGGTATFSVRRLMVIPM
jgi:hypothetical protein